MLIVQIAYLGAVIWISLCGLYSLWLTIGYWRARRRGSSVSALTRYPSVTVQLPLYNERYVVERLLAAVAALDYPRDKLQVQVLDDSADDTTALAQGLVARHAAQGLDIELVHRSERTAYKAGSLALGLSTAKGEYVAVFDADFVPPSDWLLRTLPYLEHHSDVGYVQTRWGHLNDGFSFLTMAQALVLDIQFAIEHPARCAWGCFLNANGTAGIWRRTAIDRSGGWAGDTLTEDLDLSFRMQVAGWRVLYARDVSAGGELPVAMSAFRAQQFRWVKGAAQCLRKLAAQVWSSQHPLAVRVEALAHLALCLAYPAAVLLLIVSLPLIACDAIPRVRPLAALSLGTLGVPLAMVAAQYELYGRGAGKRSWWRRAMYLPLALVVGAGLVANNARATMEGLLNHASVFQRTPKGTTGGRGEGDAYDYVLRLGPDLWLDVALAAYVAVTIVMAMRQEEWWTLPYLVLCAAGLCLVSALEVSESLWPAWRSASRRSVWRAESPVPPAED